MGILFRYVVQNMTLTTVFITCGLASFVWLGQSLRFIEMIVRHRVNLIDYLQLVLYLLPDLLAGLIPIGLALGAISTLRHLEIHHEWRAMQTMGLSPWVLYRPFALVSVIGAVLTFVSGNELAPWAFRHLKQNEFTLKSQWAPALSGSFQSVKGVTIYIQGQEKDGTLSHIFIDAPPHTFMARSGRLLRQEQQVGCHLHAGHRLEHHSDGSITQMEFDDLYYDFAAFTEQNKQKEKQKQTVKPSERCLRDLMFPDKSLPIKEQVRLKSEGHQRLLQPLLAVLDVWIVFSFTSALMAGLCIGGIHLIVLAGLPFFLSIPLLVILPYAAGIVVLAIGWYRLYANANMQGGLHQIRTVIQ